MEKSAENSFEKQWRQKFEGTSVPPPAAMWDRIEAKLDEKPNKKPFLLLWGVPAYVVSGLAATLVLAVGGWFLLTKSTENVVRENVVVQQPTEQSTRATGEKLSLKKKSALPTDEMQSLPSQKNKSEYKLNTASDLLKQYSPVSQSEKKQWASSEQFQLVSSVVQPLNQTRYPVSEQLGSSVNLLKKLTTSLNKISGQTYETYPVRYVLKRNKLAYNEPNEQATEPAKQNRKSWIGMVSGLSPFKPNFQGGNLNQLALASIDAYSTNDANFTIQRSPQNTAQMPSGTDSESSSFAIPTGNPIQQFANGRAFNLGLQAGKQLSKRLSVESGLRYIQGNSPITTNVYTIDEQNGKVSSFVQEFITQNNVASGTVIAPKETLNNSYAYLSMPVQLAYGIPLVNKLNIEVMGGVSADMFLQNVLQSETTDVATLRASDSVFRTLGVSGLGGVRLNYSLDDRWEVTVGSAFQQALVSNFEAGTSAKLRPQMLGVNYGVNYHF